VNRLPARGVYDRTAIHRILDEALICHVGLVEDGQPFVIPTIHTRIDDRLYLHGSRASRMLNHAAAGNPVCITVTIVDGLVLARSAFHHSMNYRSVVVLTTGEEVTEPAEKHIVFAALVEHVVRGRGKDARMQNEKELNATMLVGFPIDEASAKVRTGPPLDDEEDYALPMWAGVIPMSLTPGPPIPDPRLTPGIPVPAYATQYRRPL
jgi:nitroimidazol reductase NimA-like FMN-containing flavoprotein (pyridoxamine 5'-phosphate oxidase superfamily)